MRTNELVQVTIATKKRTNENLAESNIYTNDNLTNLSSKNICKEAISG